jgi:hypothetical protein
LLRKYRELINKDVLESLLWRNGLIKDRKKGLSKVKNAFVGSEVLDWLCEKLAVGRQEAVQLCQNNLLLKGKKIEFKDDTNVYSFGVWLQYQSNSFSLG